jgi:hypothetical protein
VRSGVTELPTPGPPGLPKDAVNAAPADGLTVYLSWCGATHPRAETFFSLFAGADLVGEFETREEAERALDELISAEPSAANEFAAFEFDENSKRVGEPITRAAA